MQTQMTLIIIVRHQRSTTRNYIPYLNIQSRIQVTLKKDKRTFSVENDKANILNNQIEFQSVFSPKLPVSLKSLV